MDTDSDELVFSASAMNYGMTAQGDHKIVIMVPQKIVRSMGIKSRDLLNVSVKKTDFLSPDFGIKGAWLKKGKHEARKRRQASIPTR